jgi:glycosyltransferase involved in cell wall biosynthesis
LIKKYGLEGHVTFLGRLDEQSMCERFLKSHVFVCPSSIENSPNSVGEAMILGVPTVTSDIGGVKNLLEHIKEGFVYQPDAPYMAAYYIKKIFADDKLAESISISAKKHAEMTHDRAINFNRLLEIYKEISK